MIAQWHDMSIRQNYFLENSPDSTETRKAEVSGQRSEIGSQRSDVRGQRSDVRDRKSEVRCHPSTIVNYLRGRRGKNFTE